MRNTWIRGMALAALLCTVATHASAQAYPNRAMRMIVPFAAGGGMDTVARIIGQRLSASLGQPVVVENKPGAGGTIGADQVAKASPDGYTLGMIATGHTISPSVYKSLPYDTMRDLAPVSPVVSLTNLLVVSNDFPANSVNELIGYARANPGKVTFASGGIGTAQHLYQELFATMAGVLTVHVPYKGGAPALTDVASGRVDMMLATIVETRQHVQTGRMKALAAGGKHRFAAFPELPTISEAGVPGFDGNTWFGLVAPAGTPAAIVDRLNSEVRRILAIPEVKDQLSALGAQPFVASADEFRTFLHDQIKTWDAVVKRTGLTPQ